MILLDTHVVLWWQAGNTWTRDLSGDERITPAPLSPQAAVGAALLGQHGFGGDPADRFLCATTRELSRVPADQGRPDPYEFARQIGDLKAIW